MESSEWAGYGTKVRVIASISMVFMWTVCLGAAWHSWAESSALAESGVVTTASVTEIKPNRFSTTTHVVFVTAEGRRVTASALNVGHAEAETGETIAVRYAASDPEIVQYAGDAPIDEFLLFAWMVPAIAVMTYVLFRPPSWKLKNLIARRRADAATAP